MLIYSLSFIFQCVNNLFGLMCLCMVQGTLLRWNCGIAIVVSIGDNSVEHSLRASLERNNGNDQKHKNQKLSNTMMYHVNNGSRVVNQESTAEQQLTSSTIYCNNNNASIIQNTGPGKSAAAMRKASVFSSSSANGNGGSNSHQYFGSHSYDDRKSENDKMTNDIIIANRRVTGAATASVNEFSSKKNCRARRVYDTTTANGAGIGGGASDTGSTKSTGSTYGSACSASSCSGSETSSTSGEANLPYPGFPEIALRYLAQDTRPRNWCLRLITNPWFERVSILVIIFNCITLGMYQPCVDDECVTNRCKILQVSADADVSVCWSITYARSPRLKLNVRISLIFSLTFRFRLSMT